MYNTFNNLSIKEGRKEGSFVCPIEISQTILVLSKALWVLLLKGGQWVGGVGGGGVHWCDFVMLRLMVQELMNIG